MPDRFDQWVLSYSSPETFVCASVGLEIDFMINASQRIRMYITGDRMNDNIFAMSRCLHSLATRLAEDLEDWKHVEGFKDLSGRASNLVNHLDGLDPDVRDAYQIFIDRKTLEASQRSIQMAEKSIEMSEKSIKESERVRIRECFAACSLDDY